MEQLLPHREERHQLIREAAQHLIDLMKKDIRPRDILTKEAFDNAFALDMAMGGSTNTVLHTLAIAHEAGIEYDLNAKLTHRRKSSLFVKNQPSL